METTLWIMAIYAIVIAHAILEAYREYMFYHMKATFKNDMLPWKRDEHDFYAAQRIIFFLPVVYFTGDILRNFDAAICFVLALGAIWYVMHEGMYYYFRHKANRLIYKDGFWSNNIEEEEETSDLDWDSKIRKSILVFGIFMTVGGILFIVTG